MNVTQEAASPQVPDKSQKGIFAHILKQSASADLFQLDFQLYE